MPNFDFPIHPAGAGASIWKQIGTELAAIRPSRSDLSNPNHAVNNLWGFISLPMDTGEWAYKQGDGSWRIGDEYLFPDDGAPTLSALTVISTGLTTATIGVGTNEGNGLMSVVITTSSTQPSNAQIQAGQDHTGAGAVRAPVRAITGSGTIQFAFTGLDSGTTYYAYAIHVDQAGNVSNVVSNGFATSADALTERQRFPDPEPLVGYGKDVTGGRGYPVFVVTSGASGTASGTIRWAMAQAEAAGGGYIVLAANVECLNEDTTDANTGRLVFDMPNITVDGRFAPGTGFLFGWGRLEADASNQKWMNIIHQGFIPDFTDGRDAGSNADNVRIGPWKDGADGTALTVGQYWTNCLFMGAEDEAFSVSMRGENRPTGNTARNITLARSVVHPAIAVGHEMGVYISDGVERMTMWRNYQPSYLRARWPFVRVYTTEIEVVNNYSYDGKQRQSEILGPQVHLIGNYYARGPRTGSTAESVYTYSSGVAYIEDNIAERLPLVGGSGTISGSKLFSDNSADLDVIPAQDVPLVIPNEAGPRMYGGEKYDVVEKYFAEAVAGNLPTSTRTYTTADKLAVSGGTYPTHTNYVPHSYLEIFPEDTSLASIIADGSAWDGYMVAERVGAFLQWDGVASEANLTGTYPMQFDQTDEQIIINAPAGEVVIFAISSRAIDDPGISESRSTYNASNLTDFGFVDDIENATTGVNFRLYAYVSDGETATITANNEGGLRRAISGISLSGIMGIPSGFLGSTNGTDQNSTAISVPGGTVNIGDVVIAHVSSGADTATALFLAASAAGLADVQVVHWGHSDAYSGLGHYWIMGVATSTTVGPITATASTADTWAAASIVLDV